MKICGLTKRYQTKKGARVDALCGVTLDLPEQGMVFILGSSGSGKTTLLKLLSGLEQPTEGSVLFRGEDISRMKSSTMNEYRNAYCGFVFQEYHLFPEFSVGENIALSLKLQGEKDVDEKVLNALSRVELEGYEGRKIFELSGGQKQRVAIARAIVKEPEIIFADEPTGALDFETGDHILSLLKELSKDKLVLVVTHDEDLANKYADRILRLEEGRIVFDSDPLFVAEEKSTFQPKKAFLQSRDAVRMGVSYFKLHPIRLFLTILLCVLAMTLFGLTASIEFIDQEDMTARSMLASPYPSAALRKRTDRESVELGENDYNALSEKFSVPMLRVMEDDTQFDALVRADLAPYYAFSPSAVALAEGDFEAFYSSISGEMPKGENQIAITSLIAERFVAAGLCTHEEELLGKSVLWGGEERLITGIAHSSFDGSKFQSLKERESAELEEVFRLVLQESSDNLIFLSREGFLSYEGADAAKYSAILISVHDCTRRTLLEMQNFQMNDATFFLSGVVWSAVNTAMDLLDEVSLLILFLLAVIGIFAAVLLYHMISQSIEEKFKTIALLSAMGASRGGIMKIFMIEALFVVSATAALSLSLLGILSGVFNAMLSRVVPILFFGLRWKEGLLLCASILLFSLPGVLVPLGKIKKKNLSKFLR